MRIKTKTFVLFGIILALQITVSAVIVKNVLLVGDRQKYIGVLANNLVVIGKIRNQVGRQLMLSLLYAITTDRNYRLKFDRSDQAVKRFLREWNTDYGESYKRSDISSKYGLFQEKNKKLFNFIETRNSPKGPRVFNQEILAEFAATEGKFLQRSLQEKINKIDRAYDELLLSAGFFSVGTGKLKSDMLMVKKVYGYFINLNETLSYINRYLTNSALIFLSGPNPEKFKESILETQFDFILHEWEEALLALPNPDTFLQMEGRSFFEDVEGALLHIQKSVGGVKGRLREGRREEATHIFIRSIEPVLDFVLYPTINAALSESNLLVFKLDAEIERTVSFSRNVTILLLLLLNLVVLFTSVRFLRELNHSFGMILEKLHKFSFKKEKLTPGEDEISEIESLLDAREQEFADLVRDNSLFEKIADGIKAPLFIVSGSLKIERANKAFLSLLGYNRDDLKKLSLDKVFPEAVATEKGDLEDLFIKGRGCEGKHNLVTATGGRVPVLLSASLIEEDTEQKRLFGVFVVQGLEEVSKNLPDSAAHVLSPPEEDFSRLIISGIVSEYNRSLKNTLGYLRFIFENHKEELSMSVVENLENLSREVETGTRLSENLTGFFSPYRGEAGKFEVNAAIREILKRLVSQKNAGCPVIRTDFDSLNPEIFFHREQLDFVLSSLVELLNYSARSKGRDQELLLQSLTDGNVVKIILSESADSFPDEFTSVSGILGMLKGHSPRMITSVLMAYSILKGSGGKVVGWRKVSSHFPEDEKKCYLKFVLEFPVLTGVRSQSSDFKSNVSANYDISFKNKRILIVDDEKAIRVWIEALVSRHGGIPILCKNGAEAIEKLKNGTFDLIISDLKMPEVSGYDLGEWLEKESSRMLKKFILITGLRDRELEDYCLKKRCHFLTKPVKSDTLLDLASEIME